MAGFLSGLSGLGLEDLDDKDLFGEEKKEERVKPEAPKEEDFLLEKMVLCPVCNEKTPQKILKTGKAKLLSTDVDLHPRYAVVDSVKYEVYQCSNCGYAALAQYFSQLSVKQIQMVKEGICSKVILKNKYDGAVYSYEQAVERFQLALACAMVKKTRASEKAYICLKSAWLMRGYMEKAVTDGDKELAGELQKAEQDFLEKAYQGFSMAVTAESFPICGMSETTLDYLLAALAFKLKKYDESRRLLAKVLQSREANDRVKERARTLKDEIAEAIKKS